MCGIGRYSIHGSCANENCKSCGGYTTYYNLPTRPNLGQCKAAELQLARRLLQDRYAQSVSLLIEQCIADPQVAKQCDALRNPSDQEIAEVLKGYGIICFPGPSNSPQATPE